MKSQLLVCGYTTMTPWDTGKRYALRIFIGPVLRLVHVVSQRRHAEHSAARRDGLAILQHGSGMKDHGIVCLLR